MLLNFYVQGHAPGSTPVYEDEGMLSRFSQKVQGAVESVREMSTDEMKQEAEQRLHRLVDIFRGMFRFLAGSEDVHPTPQPAPEQEQKTVKQEGGWFSSVTGMFSGIKGPSSSASSSAESWSGPAFTEGEVHADLVMVRLTRVHDDWGLNDTVQNEQGYYEFRYLLIDMPSECWT